MINLYSHQKKFLEENPNKAILAWEMRVGKSLPASLWGQKKQSCLIICPKQLLKDWQILAPFAVVMTKEQFKKNPPTVFNSLIVDEAHFFASPLFLKGRSQLATAMYEFIKTNPDMDVLLLTGTPIRQDAWSLHTLLCYIGVYYDWKWWRNEFFELKYLPFLPRPAWMPRSDWRTKIRPYMEKHCHIVSLRDIIDDLPPIETTFVPIKHEPYKKPIDEVVTWSHEHQYEQEDKYKEILKLDYRKIIIVVHYTDQIDTLKKQLEKDKPVFVLDGRTKDADIVKKQAQEADDCYFIVQASMGYGWDGWMFSAMVFASMSHSCLNHTQMLGRPRHQEHLHTIPVYYLIGGRWDQRIYDTIEAGKEFNPHIYEK